MFDVNRPLRILMVGGAFRDVMGDFAQNSPEGRLAQALELQGHLVARAHHDELGQYTDFDVVHIHHRSSASLLYMLRHRRLPIVFTGHSHLAWSSNFRPYSRADWEQKLVLDAHFRLATRVMALSDSERAAITARHQRARVDVSANLVSDRIFGDPTGIRPRRNQASPYLVFVGQLIELKGIDTLIRALLSVPGVRLKLVYHQDSLELRLRRLVAALGLADRVEFVGRLQAEQVASTIRASIGLVLPSWGECYPSVVTEAQIAEVPVVASDVGAVAEQLAGRGFLVPPGDEIGLAAALRAVLVAPPSVCSLHAARQRALERAAESRVVSTHLRAYRLAIGSSLTTQHT